MPPVIGAFIKLPPLFVLELCHQVVSDEVAAGRSRTVTSGWKGDTLALVPAGLCDCDSQGP